LNMFQETDEQTFSIKVGTDAEKGHIMKTTIQDTILGAHRCVGNLRLNEGETDALPTDRTHDIADIPLQDTPSAPERNEREKMDIPPPIETSHQPFSGSHNDENYSEMHRRNEIEVSTIDNHGDSNPQPSVHCDSNFYSSEMYPINQDEINSPSSERSDARSGSTEAFCCSEASCFGRCSIHDKTIDSHIATTPVCLVSI